MATKMTYSWIIYLCLIFGSSILCDPKFKKRSAVSSGFVNAEDKFNCSNGVFIKSSRVCDGFKDCSDGSDETNASCARIKYGTNMTTDCGKLYMNRVLIKNGQKADVQMAPWNVGIYRHRQFIQRNSNYDLICGGSLISSNLVVSAAHCFWETGHTSNNISIEDDLYKIAVGKYVKNITIVDNYITPLMNVDIVYLKGEYYGRSAFYAEDIAIIVLKNRVSFSDSVAPICIDWNGKYYEVNGDQGKIVNWGHTNNDNLSPALLNASLRFINHRSCQNIFTNEFESYVTFDKFCAGFVMGEGMDVVYYGGLDLSFFHDNSYYLTGVASIKNSQRTNSVAVFTDVKYHIQWIRGLYNRYRPQAVSSFSGNVKDMFTCSNGVSIEKSWTCDGLKDCSDGSDETNELCSRNENETNMTTDCVRACKNQVLLQNNQSALVETAPWNVGVYRFNEINSNYDLICGGSLISSNLVVSAAHCFYDGHISFNGTHYLLDDDPYKVAVGKYNRNITNIDSKFTQIMNVEIVYVHKDFKGFDKFYSDNIAIIVLKNRVSLSNSVAPVSIDWYFKYNEAKGDLGKIVGWGRTNNGIPIPILLEASLPYIDRSTCRDILFTNGYASYVTLDKFCAGTALGPEVDMGYGGEGLSFLHSNSYYLTGIASVKDTKTINSIAYFTRVRSHIRWIRLLYNKYL